MSRWKWLGEEQGPGAAALRVARFCVLLLACVVPFSIALTEAALITGLVALFVAKRQGRAWTFERTALDWACLGVAASWILASLTSPEKLASFIHVRKLYAMGLIYLTAETMRLPAARARFLPLVAAGASLTAVAGYLIYAIMIRVEPGYRLKGLLSNQMTSGGVLAAAALWTLGAVTTGSRQRRIALGAVLAVLLPALALTQTRSHWLGFAVGAATILLSRVPRAWWVVPVGGIAFRFAAPARLAARFASILDPHEPGNAGRLSMWRSGWDIFREHPITGAGVQDLLALYRRHKYPDATFEAGHFHNNFVQFAVSAGVLGLGAFTFWVVAGARQLLRARAVASADDRGLMASALAIFAAMLVAGMFDFTFGDAEVVYHSYLALGLALAVLPARGASGAAAAP